MKIFDFFKKNIIIFIVFFGLGLLAITGYYKCPASYIFGIPCPVCGITRALTSAITGHISDAFYYHPLWPIAPLFLLFQLLINAEIIKIPKPIYSFILIIIAISLIICFILRHIYHSPIVEIHFYDSILCKFINIFTQ